MTDQRDDDQHDQQAELERDDREASGGDAEAAGTVDQREDVASGDDDLFDDEVE